MIFRLAIMGVVLFSVAIMVIQSQPYDDSDLRALLTPPDGCPTPCFLGIRPGVTTTSEAITILEANDWIGQVDSEVVPYITWTWSGRQPAIIQTASKGILSFFPNRQVVLDIAIQTSLPVAAMYLLGGGPVIENSKIFKRGKVYATIVYPEFSIMTFANMTCPVTARLFWGSPLGIEFMHDIDSITADGEIARSIDLYC